MNLQIMPIITQPGEGHDLHAFGNILTVMLDGEHTGGTLSVMTEQTLPGGGPPLHVHSKEDEIFIVAEGRISHFVGGGWTEVGVGGVVYLPKGVPHRFRNIGTIPSRHWIITLPSGFEEFFATCADEFTKAGGADKDRLVEIHRDHGIELLE
jgi:mannose-6-phosphate isomerase-like protein (cupin superfamily)